MNRTKHIFITFGLLLAAMTAQSQENKEVVVKSEVSSATVFIDGAQISRKKTVDVPAGKSRIRFTGLSPYIDPKSVQVKVDGEVMVTSVNHQINYIDSTKNIKPKDPNKRLLEINDTLDEQNINKSLLKDEIDFLETNKKIGGNNTGVSLLTLKETANYYRERMTSLKVKQAAIDKKIKELEWERAAILNNDKQEGVTAKPSATGEILIDVESKRSLRPSIEVDYYVKNAGWYPSYDIRATSIDKPIELIYKANVRQNTKEDWKNVNLKISSSNPTLGNTIPQLKTYYLNYYTPAPRYNVQAVNNAITGTVTDEQGDPLVGASVQITGTTIGTVADVDGTFSIPRPQNATTISVKYPGFIPQDLSISNSHMTIRLRENQQMLSEVVVMGYGVSTPRALAGSVADVSADRKKGTPIKALRKDIAVPIAQTETQTSVEFDIKVPYSIKSDNKNTAIEVDRYSLPAQFEYYSIPKIIPEAFLRANILDWEKYNLLEGEANIFFEGTYIGKTIIDVRNVSDTLSISMGRDKNVSVKRESVKEYTSKKFLGSKKEDSRAWKIAVKNNKRQPIDIVILDQIPVSATTEIEVTTEDVSNGATNSENGEIKWQLRLDANDKKDLNLKYKVKYPKNRTLNIE